MRIILHKMQLRPSLPMEKAAAQFRNIPTGGPDMDTAAGHQQVHQRRANQPTGAGNKDPPARQTLPAGHRSLHPHQILDVVFGIGHGHSPPKNAKFKMQNVCCKLNFAFCITAKLRQSLIQESCFIYSRALKIFRSSVVVIFRFSSEPLEK